MASSSVMVGVEIEDGFLEMRDERKGDLRPVLGGSLRQAVGEELPEVLGSQTVLERRLFLLGRERPGRCGQRGAVGRADRAGDPPGGKKGGQNGQGPDQRASPTPALRHCFPARHTRASDSGVQPEPAKSPKNRIPGKPACDSISLSSSG